MSSIETAHAHATAELDRAIAATTEAPDLNAALDLLKEEHLAALSTATNTDLLLTPRIKALIPLAEAVDRVQIAGLSHPDQTHTMHVVAKDAIHACAMTGMAVVADLLTKIGK